MSGGHVMEARSVYCRHCGAVYSSGSFVPRDRESTINPFHYKWKNDEDIHNGTKCLYCDSPVEMYCFDDDELWNIIKEKYPKEFVFVPYYILFRRYIHETKLKDVVFDEDAVKRRHQNEEAYNEIKEIEKAETLKSKRATLAQYDELPSSLKTYRPQYDLSEIRVKTANDLAPSIEELLGNKRKNHIFEGDIMERKVVCCSHCGSIYPMSLTVPYYKMREVNSFHYKWLTDDDIQNGTKCLYCDSPTEIFTYNLEKMADTLNQRYPDEYSDSNFANLRQRYILETKFKDTVFDEKAIQRRNENMEAEKAIRAAFYAECEAVKERDYEEFRWWQAVKYSNLPSCPTCHSKDIRRITSGEKVVNAAMFGIWGTKRRQQFQCNNCGYRW